MHRDLKYSWYTQNSPLSDIARSPMPMPRTNAVPQSVINNLENGTYGEWATPGETEETCPICFDDVSHICHVLNGLLMMNSIDHRTLCSDYHTASIGSINHVSRFVDN